MALTTLCYIKDNNKTLMLHRIKKQNDIHEGKWNGLGGHIEQGETPEECVIREVYEESGLTLKNPNSEVSSLSHYLMALRMNIHFFIPLTSLREN